MAQRGDELVEHRLALRLGRLDQHRAVHDEREVHRHRVIALVDQRLGDVDRGDPGTIEEMIVEQRLVHARAGVAERRRHHVVEAAQHVVGVQHRVLGDLPEAVGAVAHDVAERAHEHAHLAVERDHAPEALRVRVPADMRLLLLDQLEVRSGVTHERQRRERRQRRREHHRPRARSAAAMRRREGLVEVDVHRIDAKVSGADAADDGVEVGTVAIDVGTRRMRGFGNGDHVRLEQAARIGVGDHHRRHVRAQPRLQRREIDTARRRRRDILHLIATEGRRGGVGAMRGFGDEHDLARLAARLVRGADREHAAQLAVRARLRAHGDLGHAGQRLQPVG